MADRVAASGLTPAPAAGAGAGGADVGRDESWHARDAVAVLAALGTSADAGLSEAEAAERLARYGPNRLPAAPPEPWWRVLAAQFRSVIVALLVGAALLALATGDRADAAAVAVVLLLNVALGFATELRARRAMEALLALQAPRAAVLRDGRVREVAADALVPGDLLVLEAGASVSADARVVAASDLRAAEAALTGESVPVAKRAAPPARPDAALAERATMLYTGTSVAAGEARAVAVATGAATELGRIGALTAAVRVEPTPLERRLDALGRRLALAAGSVAVLVGALYLARGERLAVVLETSLALAVAAVPEGLPAVVTITMAVGVWRMARRRALVRRLPTVEGLGAATVVCTDKTGTLTVGEMTVTALWAYAGGAGRAYAVTGAGYGPEGTVRRAAASDGALSVIAADDPALARLLEAGALANRADVRRDEAGRWAARGDPTDAALLVAAAKAGVDRAALVRARPEVAALPFSSERMLMATFHREAPGAVAAMVKGAPDRVLARCALGAAERAGLAAANDALAARGLRVLALAAGTLAGDVVPGTPGAATPDASTPGADAPGADALDAALTSLTFLGFAGMADPPAPGVRETVARLRAAGIRTVMLTGDQRGTAEAVARELGVLAPGEEVLHGREVDALGDDALRARAPGVGAISRVSPEGKLRVVGALQARGEVVAMLGDGVNDAPALRRADVGVAMGRRGTDVAKEAAGVVLEDDRFETVAAAVEEGRVIYANVRAFVWYLLACNLAEILVLLAAGLLGWPAPLTPLQILWLNLVTDTFPALALALEPAAPDVMRRPPRDPRAPVLSRRAVAPAAAYAAAVAACALAAFWYGGRGGAGGTPPGGAVLGGPVPGGDRATTLSFVVLALAQVALLANARARGRRPTPRLLLANRWALAAAAVTVALQVAAVSTRAVAGVLGAAPLDAPAWAVAGALAVAPAALGLVLAAAAGRSSARATAA